MEMNLDALYSELTLKTNAKLALVVLDGVGDLATSSQGELTPLEAAKTPNLDALVARGCAQGRMIPIAQGITPGSGPGHLALFGYDPSVSNSRRAMWRRAPTSARSTLRAL
jgi:2,3-bisphosphoglycerate-independent phosphoglycerate mutase